jgi:environmental stress-induced protein Ves
LKIIRKQEQKTALWSGGKTTELFIFPEGSSYSERNFQFRISTATVETETSEFTRLNGFRRHLMILDGTLKIHHKNHYQKTLNKFDIDVFMGDWETTAEGKVTDFNLMHDENFKGKIEVLHLDKNRCRYLNADTDFLGLYVLNGNFFINKTQLEKGDFITLKNREYKIVTHENESCTLVCVYFFKVAF